MLHVWVCLGLLIFFWVGRWYYRWILPPKKKLAQQILKKAQRVRHLMEDLEDKERNIAYLKRDIAQMIHQYRRK